jgi:hypothetical protein
MISDLIVFQKTYDFLLWVKPTVQRFAKVHKYSLGVQLEQESVKLLQQIIRANLYKKERRGRIAECFVEYETIKILVRLSKDFDLLSVKQYEFASVRLNEIGKLLGGWYKAF